MNKAEEKYKQLLDKQGIDWRTVPFKTFKLTNTTYTPDFYLPQTNTYIEIIGSYAGYTQNRNKIYEFKKIYPEINLKVLNCKGESYPPLNSKIKKRGKYYHKYCVALVEQKEIEMQAVLSKFRIIDIVNMGITEALKQCPKPPAKLIKRAKEICK